MPYVKNKPPPVQGAGELRFRGFRGPVDYEVQGEPGGLALGRGALRGSLKTSPEVAEQAFRAGDCVLTLEAGAPYRLTMLGHTAGSGTAYFEMRV